MANLLFLGRGWWMNDLFDDGHVFAGLTRNGAGALLIDPPYHFKRYSEKPSALSVGRAPQDHYDTMTLEEMKALPVRELAAPDCIMFIWTTWPHLLQCIELIRTYGFEYKTCAFDWMKANVSTLNMFPEPIDADMKMGYYTRSNSEPCLLATLGQPKRMDAGVRMGIIEPARAHSRKPDCIYERIERLVGDVPKVELFSRTNRKGWNSWGNNAGKFGTV